MSAGKVSSDRNFDQYKNGFGDPHQQAVWLGLERLYLLTHQIETSLRLTLERCPNATRPQLTTTCTYAQFKVYAANTQYAVFLPNYCQGNESSPNQDGWVDWPINEVGPAFQTYDMAPNYIKPCIDIYHKVGWWFSRSSCGLVNLNGIRPKCADIGSDKQSYSYLTWRSETLEDAWLYLRPRQYPHYDKVA